MTGPSKSRICSWESSIVPFAALPRRTTIRLAGLYEQLYEHGSQVRLTLREFAALIGQPKEEVLCGAPRHATVAISPWGLHTEYPEMHLVRDMAVAFKSAVTLDAEIK